MPLVGRAHGSSRSRVATGILPAVEAPSGEVRYPCRKCRCSPGMISVDGFATEERSPDSFDGIPADFVVASRERRLLSGIVWEFLQEVPAVVGDVRPLASAFPSAQYVSFSFVASHISPGCCWSFRSRASNCRRGSSTSISPSLWQSACWSGNRDTRRRTDYTTRKSHRSDTDSRRFRTLNLNFSSQRIGQRGAKIGETSVTAGHRGGWLARKFLFFQFLGGGARQEKNQIQSLESRHDVCGGGILSGRIRSPQSGPVQRKQALCRSEEKKFGRAPLPMEKRLRNDQQQLCDMRSNKREDHLRAEGTCRKGRRVNRCGDRQDSQASRVGEAVRSLQRNRCASNDRGGRLLAQATTKATRESDITTWE